MPTIIIHTAINASIETVFDLARDIDLHKKSCEHTKEEAIRGKTSGLIELNETVTWRAKHFGIWQTLTSKITAFEKPKFFVDEMVKGAFKSFTHEHHFSQIQETTFMKDVFHYQAPWGILGKAATFIFLHKYMTNFLKHRNRTIKNYAEQLYKKK